MNAAKNALKKEEADWHECMKSDWHQEFWTNN